ncbi:MAG TPA: LON peptidase substrate-binding domain-containing protein [Acidimicrobiia bacterium]|nr:LON peptidase substrate-binding domain-containing protein [Acidimicrobiia bacterium]
MKIPMFPLTSVVYPFTAIPIRVFEPRYQTLLDRVLADDRSFGMVLIERGREVGGGDVRFSIGTMVRVIAVNPIPGTDDRAVVVAGLKRIRVVDWLADDPHPMAEVEDYPDVEADPLVDVDPAMCSLRRVFALASELGSDVSGIELEFAEDPLAASYQLAALCPLNALDSQRLLEASGASTRLDLARSMLDDRAELLRIELSAS